MIYKLFSLQPFTCLVPCILTFLFLPPLPPPHHLPGLLWILLLYFFCSKISFSPSGCLSTLCLSSAERAWPCEACICLIFWLLKICIYEVLNVPSAGTFHTHARAFWVSAATWKESCSKVRSSPHRGASSSTARKNKRFHGDETETRLINSDFCK